MPTGAKAPERLSPLQVISGQGPGGRGRSLRVTRSGWQAGVGPHCVTLSSAPDLFCPVSCPCRGRWRRSPRGAVAQGCAGCRGPTRALPQACGGASPSHLGVFRAAGPEPGTLLASPRPLTGETGPACQGAGRAVGTGRQEAGGLGDLPPGAVPLRGTFQPAASELRRAFRRGWHGGRDQGAPLTLTVWVGTACGLV